MYPLQAIFNVYEKLAGRLKHLRLFLNGALLMILRKSRPPQRR